MDETIGMLNLLQLAIQRAKMDAETGILLVISFPYSHSSSSYYYTAQGLTERHATWARYLLPATHKVGHGLAALRPVSK
jgi:hypothetical protein